MPFISSVRGSYGAQGRFGKRAIGLAQNGSGEYYISGATIRHATDVLAYVANPPAGKWRIQPEGWGGQYITVYARYDSVANKMSQSIFTMDGASTVTVGSASSIANGQANLGAPDVSSFDDNSSNKMGPDLRGYIHRFSTGGNETTYGNGGQWNPADWPQMQSAAIWASAAGNSTNFSGQIHPALTGVNFGSQPSGGYYGAFFPVHFAHAKSTGHQSVWFDIKGERILFQNGSSISFASAGISFSGVIASSWLPGGANYSATFKAYQYGHQFTSVSDGVNSCVFGFVQDLAQSDPITVSTKLYSMVFDFNNYTIKSVSLETMPSLNFSSHDSRGPFHDRVKSSGQSSLGNCYNAPEESIGGTRLYTVDGYVPYLYHKTWKYGSGTMYNPAQPGNMSSLTLDYWGSGPGSPNATPQVGGDTQSQSDLMFSVDSNNFVWFADWGHDDGGLYNIGNDSDLGSQITNIKRLVPAGSANP